MPSECPVVVATARLDVRPWQLSEAARLLDIRSRPDIARWLSDPQPWSDLERARREIEGWAVPEPAHPHLGIWTVVPRATGIPVGTAALKHLPDSHEVEIGWYLHPDATGQGYAREAAAGVLAHGVRAGV